MHQQFSPFTDTLLGDYLGDYVDLGPLSDTLPSLMESIYTHIHLSVIGPH